MCALVTCGEQLPPEDFHSTGEVNWLKLGVPARAFTLLPLTLGKPLQGAVVPKGRGINPFSCVIARSAVGSLTGSLSAICSIRSAFFFFSPVTLSQTSESMDRFVSS